MELFRALSTFPHLYTVLGVDTNLSNEKVGQQSCRALTHSAVRNKFYTTGVLSSCCIGHANSFSPHHHPTKVKSTFKYIWFYFHSLVTVLLGAWKDKNASFVAVEACLDIIRYAISISVYVQVCTYTYTHPSSTT